MARPAEFGGRIGRDWRDSEPWWPPDPTPPDGAPNVLLVVLDDVGFAQLGCYGSDIGTPTIDGLAATGVRLTNFHTTALCSPTRSCLLTGRNHHRNGLGRVADLAIGYPGYNGEIPQGERLPLGDPPPPRLRHLRGRQVAPHPGRRDQHGRARGTAGRSAGASTAGTASTGARPTSSCPILYHDNHSIVPAGSGDRRGVPPERRPGRPGDHLSRRPAGGRRRPPVLPLLLHRRLPLAPPRAPRMDRALPGPLRPGLGRPGARRSSPARSTEGCFPPGAEIAPARLGARPGTTCPPSSRRSRLASWSASPPSSRTPTRSWRGCSPSSTQTGDRDDTLVMLVSDNGASSEGGPNGSINDNRLQNVDPAGPNELLRRHRRDRRPERPQQLPVGLDDGRQHAVQAAGSARSTKAGWPTRAS